MVLPNNATGFSSTVKIKPNGSAAEIGRPTIHTGNDSGVRCDAVNTCYKIGFNDAQKSIYAGCPAGDFTGPILVNSNNTRIDNQTQAYAYCTGFTDGSARPAR